MLVRFRWLWLFPTALLIASATVPITGPQWLQGPCTQETNYFCIKVQEEERGNDLVRILILDRLVHSYSSLKDPTKLVYGYEKVYGEITAYQAHRKERLRALFIGGGGYTFPRYMEALYPDSDLHVIEIDPGVTEIAHDMLGLRRGTEIVTYNEDARMFLARLPTGTFDLIMGDAFNDYGVPYHLTTREFNDLVHAWLAEDGLYVVNVIDGAYGRFLRAYMRTMRQTFAYVYLAPTIDSWQEVSRSTFVVVGSDTPLDLPTLREVNGGSPLFTQQLLSQEDIDSFLDNERLVMLTDQYAPVDQMLAPVFQDKVAR